MVERELTDASDALRAASPLWRALITAGGNPVSLDTIQQKLVAYRGLVLLYSSGIARSYVFVIPPATSVEDESTRLQAVWAPLVLTGVR